LGTAGIIPSLNIPGGLLSFAAIKSLTTVGSSMQLAQRAPMLHHMFFRHFGLQENAVMQTYLLSMMAGGFGSYITGAQLLPGQSTAGRQARQQQQQQQQITIVATVWRPYSSVQQQALPLNVPSRISQVRRCCLW
jgi:hypothetical protein